MVIPPLLAALRCYQQKMDQRFIISFLSLMGMSHIYIYYIYYILSDIKLGNVQYCMIKMQQLVLKLNKWYNCSSKIISPKLIMFNNMIEHNINYQGFVHDQNNFNPFLPRGSPLTSKIVWS